MGLFGYRGEQGDLNTGESFLVRRGTVTSRIILMAVVHDLGLAVVCGKNRWGDLGCVKITTRTVRRGIYACVLFPPTVLEPSRSESTLGSTLFIMSLLCGPAVFCAVPEPAVA